MVRNAKNGFTLVEVLIASALFVVLTLISISAVISTGQGVAAQEKSLQMDQAGQYALSVMSENLASAILPISRDPGAVENSVFEDIDDETVGFGGANGVAWRGRLRNTGMDNIAFITPVDAQGVGDFYDSEGHLQVGYAANNQVRMSASVSGTPGDDDFVMRAGANELVNILAAIDAAQFDSEAFEMIENPTGAQWKNVCSEDYENSVTTFIAFRFVPLLRSSDGLPIVISEARPYGDKFPYAVDLDSDESVTGQFHIGHIQMLYSGGTAPTLRNGTLLGDIPMDQRIVSLTPDIVLRRVDRASPIFQMADTGVVSGGGSSLLYVRLLLLDHKGVSDAGVLDLGAYSKTTPNQGRWYETSIALRNLDR